MIITCIRAQKFLKDLTHISKIENLIKKNKLPEKDRFLFQLLTDLKEYFDNSKNFEYLKRISEDDHISKTWIDHIMETKKKSLFHQSNELNNSNDFNEEKLRQYFKKLSTILSEKNNSSSIEDTLNLKDLKCRLCLKENYNNDETKKFQNDENSISKNDIKQDNKLL